MPSRSAFRVATRDPYTINAGNGLALRINPDGTRYWIQASPPDGGPALIVGAWPDLAPHDAQTRRVALETEIAAMRSGAVPIDAQAASTGVPAAVKPPPSQARRAFLQSSLAAAGMIALPSAAAPPDGAEGTPADMQIPSDAENGASHAAAAGAPPSTAPPHHGKPPRHFKAWIQHPRSFGEASYVRYSPINVVRGAVDVELRSAAPIESAVIKIMDRHGEIARSPVLRTEPYLWTLDTRSLPEGNLVIDAELAPAMPFLHAVVVIDNDGAPVTGEQWIPVGARNTLEEFTSNAWGYEWVKYPATRRGGRLVPRPGIPFSQRPGHKNLWQQAMTSTSVTRHDPSRQFATIEGGHVSVVERQSYTQVDNFKLLVGNCIDGAYGVGRVGSMWNGYVDSGGALVGICGQGRGVRIDLEGRIETLIGPRLRQDVEPPIFLPSGTDAQWAWLDTFYEHVGTISDGPPRLSNPWQMVADPHDENVLYIADSDNNRVVVYDVRLKQGRTLAGGVEGFADGVGLTAQFNRPRGLAWSRDGETLYVADDHNSAIRTLNRAGAVRTLVHSARGTNYDLVLMQPQFRKMQDFATMIRGQMRDGRFGEANFMHPNTLAIDSEGNLLSACHHPHVVVKFDLAARRVETLVELPLGNLQMHRLALAWISLSVDRWGAFGAKDQFAVAYWMQQSFFLYDKSGSKAGYYIGPDHPAASGYLENGPVYDCKYTSYPAFCVFGPDGSFWHGGTAGDGVYRQTARQATDPEIDEALYKRGLELYTTGVPAPHYRRGWRGHSHLGETSFYDFADQPDEAIAAWIATWPVRYTKDDVAALTYFIRWQA